MGPLMDLGSIPNIRQIRLPRRRLLELDELSLFTIFFCRGAVELIRYTKKPGSPSRPQSSLEGIVQGKNSFPFSNCNVNSGACTAMGYY